MTWKFMGPVLSLLLTHDASAQDLWALSREQTLTVDSVEHPKGMLEIMPSKNCDALELRLWTEFVRSSVQGVSSGDAVELSFFLADKQIASEGHLLEIYPSESSDSDLVYIRLGYWDWDVIDHLPQYTEHSQFSLYAEGVELSSSSKWPVANLTDSLEILKLGCDTHKNDTLI